MKVESLKTVASLKVLQRKAAAEAPGGRASVVVGFTGAAALYVHEMTPKNRGKPRRSGIGVYWGPAGGPKFLEAPARELARDIARIISDAFKRGTALLQCLFLGGLRLQRESMQRVPVEYGDLRRTAFTAKESGSSAAQGQEH